MSNEFTDNELKSILVNIIGRSGEAGDKSIMKIDLKDTITLFIKPLILLFLCAVYSNAYSPLKLTECSLSRYESNNTKCVKLVYDEVNERLERTYKNILKNIPRADTIEVIQKYTSLLKTKNEVCGKSSNDEIESYCESEEITAYKDSETERKCEAAKDEFCFFYWRYKEVPKKIYENNASTIKKQYDSWLKSKNEFCKQYSNDEIKLKSCHIDYFISKLNEFWDLESLLLEHPFEGKWTGCSYHTRDDNLDCGTRFIVEQNDNVCSGDWRGIDPNNRYLSIELYGKSGNYIYPFKLCVNCDILEDGYDEQGRKTYQTSIPFSEWEDDISDAWQVVQYYFHKEPSPSTSIKTPFLPGEREELIQTNKWLKDCLNYKGE